MNKYFLILGLLFFITPASAQEQCACGTNKKLSELIDCKPIKLKNQAQLYWQFNCDSSWLTFKSKSGIKKIIYSMPIAIEHTGQLGYSFATEYKQGFLIKNDVIAGCCAPPRFILFDKNTGDKLVDYGPLLFYSKDYQIPVVAYYRDDAIIIRNVGTNKLNIVNLPKGLIPHSQKAGERPAPEYLFDTETAGKDLIITYRYLKPNPNESWQKESVKIDLEKYREK
ncbi:MAG: hypothetical protein JKY70_11260 [Mucilaginibacter sp.]|nr:hypothetical protein [Mucilaginibacter sp.]